MSPTPRFVGLVLNCIFLTPVESEKRNSDARRELARMRVELDTGQHLRSSHACKAGLRGRAKLSSQIGFAIDLDSLMRTSRSAGRIAGSLAKFDRGSGSVRSP